ncbi:MAG: bifunctional glutamate N-acetyltransferase/amino-acid acetyltransferase ArgJ [Verrucomicrobiota bacterium]|nr:bifunctional glutamate N-acetyltransferase/amino-acid acetyltransferase ArgJ [Verrucomicrobiota bacterium]
MAKFKQIKGSITAPQGFRTAACFCDIKTLGTGKGSKKGQKNDLALIVSDAPAKAAGMFTTNQVCAAPVKVCVEQLKNNNTAQAVVVNSGNANACTGAQGTADAREMVTLTSQALGISQANVLVGSTGRIGIQLPMPNVRRGIAEVTTKLQPTRAAATLAAKAIMTSDTRTKEVAVEFKLGGKTVRLGGIAKGAGMIQPGMSPDGARPASSPQGLHATMLAYLTTDANIYAGNLKKCLREAVARSFNCITVDGDMSTNDTVLILANGLAENGKLSAADLKTFQAALNHICLELAKMIVRDGEGITRVVTVRVTGAKSNADADAAARSVGNSALVKTSWCGGDPNWGRIIDALGYSTTTVVEEKVDIAYSNTGSRKKVFSLKKGRPTQISFETLCKAVEPEEFDLHINLNLGRGAAILYAADLTEKYVDFNKGDITDPASLGG